MARIQLLTDKVINKIAAGEVVERPASIIKELVENAIDAGASHISVSLEDGGKKRITVMDDGFGIGRDDLPLAIARHATSKIQSEEDLFQIASMGFRGEALASIAAVSEFVLRTQTRDSRVGSAIEVRGGDVGSVIDWQGQPGTSVTVSNLFFNVPARRSFLKSTPSEQAACLEQLQVIALAYPHIGFSLEHNGKRILTCERLDDGLTWERAIRQRASDIIGEGVCDGLIYVEKAAKVASVKALISVPGKSFPHSKHMYLYLNGRAIKDKVVRFGILRGYHSHLLKGRYPCVIANVQSDPSLVDVNVHPAKTEVRFQYANEVQGLIAIAVREALRDGIWALDKDAVSESSGEAAAQLAPPAFVPTERPRSASQSLDRGSFWAGSARSQVIIPERLPAGALTTNRFDVPPDPREGIPWDRLSYVGVYARCYLMFEHAERLLVIDQHAFHERVMYERLKHRLSDYCVAQPMIMPEAIQLAASDVAILHERQQTLRTYGFKLTAVDAVHIEVSAVPDLLRNRDLHTVLSDMAAALGLASAAPSASDVAFHDLLSTMACHSAVRAGEALPENELQMLLNEAATVDFYHNCPHGRPVFKWWTQAQVAAWFDR